MSETSGNHLLLYGTKIGQSFVFVKLRSPVNSRYGIAENVSSEA
jgi:hypothetical protein